MEEEIEKLNQRINELETMNAILIDRVKAYENMNVVKTIILLTKQYEYLEKRLQEAETKLKQAEDYVGKMDQDPSLKGKFVQTLEDALNNKDIEDMPEIIKTVTKLANSIK